MGCPGFRVRRSSVVRASVFGCFLVDPVEEIPQVSSPNLVDVNSRPAAGRGAGFLPAVATPARSAACCTLRPRPIRNRGKCAGCRPAELAAVDATACRKKTAKLAAVQITSVNWSSWSTLDGVAISASGCCRPGARTVFALDGTCHAVLGTFNFGSNRVRCAPPNAG